MAYIEKKYHIGIKEIGKNNVITNTAILGIFEDVACIHSDMVGYGVMDIEKTHLSWVLLNWKVQILQRVSYGSDVLARTWASGSNKFYTYRDFELEDENRKFNCYSNNKMDSY